MYAMFNVYILKMYLAANFVCTFRFVYSIKTQT